MVSCWENDREKKDTELYSLKTEVTFHDNKDIQKFKDNLKTLNTEIKSNTGDITYDQIVKKARLLDYLWNTWEALELYVNHLGLNKNNELLAYNHNIAKLYEKLWEYDWALKFYWILVQDFKSNNYLKDIARIWKKRWNIEKYNKAMDLYNTYYKDSIVVNIQK